MKLPVIDPSLLEVTLANIVPVDPILPAQTQALLDNKTKPRRSLGQLEDLACRIAAACGESRPAKRRPAVVVMAGDHGVAESGVSAYPQEVTAQMVANFAAGGAAINALASHGGIYLQIVDMGVINPIPGLANVVDRRVRAGTRNLMFEPAMTQEEARQALSIGIETANELITAGYNIIGLGEMGIANTTSASALTAVWLELDAAEVTGHGTGIDDEGLRKKIDVVRKAKQRHGDPSNALATLAGLGGLEIAGLAGLILGCAARRVPVVVDGFITAAAALAAVRIKPVASDYLIAAHQSVEIGHGHILNALGLRPLLNLQMRLGEGTGAALAMHLVSASLAILDDMATFGDAGVSDTGA